MALLTTDEIVRLSPPERIELIGQLWDSLEEHEVPLSDAQMQELDRRVALLDDDRSGHSWVSLKAELERRCP